MVGSLQDRKVNPFRGRLPRTSVCPRMTDGEKLTSSVEPGKPCGPAQALTSGPGVPQSIACSIAPLIHSASAWSWSMAQHFRLEAVPETTLTL